MHGAKLSREAVVAGLTHWRLHLTILAFTFVLFPVLGLAISRSGLLSPDPVDRHAVPVLPALDRAVVDRLHLDRPGQCGRRRLRGVGLEPAGHLPDAGAGGPADARPWRRRRLGLDPARSSSSCCCRSSPASWCARGSAVDRAPQDPGRPVDRGSILLVVYSAFSAAVVGGIWKIGVDRPNCCLLLVACVVLLAAVMAATVFGSRALGFSKADEIVHRLLRLQEEPGQRRADGEHPVPRRNPWPAGAAADAVPPDPADGLLGDRPALRRATGRRGLKRA
jgi:sodium/bile acid cotransporter 7